MKIKRHFQTSVCDPQDRFKRFNVGIDIEKEFADDEVKTVAQIEEKSNSMLKIARSIVEKELAELRKQLEARRG
jgi:hypothetical protein